MSCKIQGGVGAETSQSTGTVMTATPTSDFSLRALDQLVRQQHTTRAAIARWLVIEVLMGGTTNGRRPPPQKSPPLEGCSPCQLASYLELT